MLWAGTVLAVTAMCYTLTAALAVRVRLKAAAYEPPDQAPAVTILKPLCGDEHQLYECLRSFCDQLYPRFQIVFGVSDGDDPAVEVVSRLQREFPHLDLQIAVDRRQHGSSRKVSNLINMMSLARHDYLVISDSDVRVLPDYLARVVTPLLDPEVGIVTCPYRGTPRPGFWSLLGSLFINEWFTPSVLVAAMFGSRSFAFGTTIAMRRQVLASAGGFAAIANQLADDYRLGELTRRMGLRTVLSDVVVETCVDEASFGDLVSHELRWLRTIRAVRPLGYSLLFITFGVPVALVGVPARRRRLARARHARDHRAGEGCATLDGTQAALVARASSSRCRSGMGSCWRSGHGASSTAACTGGMTAIESLVMDPSNPFLRI